MIARLSVLLLQNSALLRLRLQMVLGACRAAWGRVRIRDLAALAGAIGLTLVGLFCIVLATASNLDAWSIRQRWVDSGDAQRAEQAASAESPIWVPDGSPSPSVTGAVAASARSGTVVPVANAAAVDLVGAGFVFLDPPEPGARVRLSVTLRVRSELASPAIVLAIPAEWLEHYRITTSTPIATLEPASDDGTRRLLFPGLPQGTTSLFVDGVATAEGTDPPVVRVELADSAAAIGEAHPQTVAPRPRPGPISSVRIPKLGIRAAVVPTTWEPPAFVVGQLRDSASVTLGNSVLIGHLTGAAGAVFKNLDQLTRGDTIVAVSRGLEYTFMVSDTQTRPADDSQPAAPEARPRLTLMTCTGTWDPLARNYSDRLWVIAEPPDLAWATIAANASRPPTPVPARHVPAPEPAADSQSSQPLPANLGPAGGLGATRASLDAALGPPVGETPGKLVVYRRGAVDYHVAFSPDPPRAQLISVLPSVRNAPLTSAAAVERGRSLFPTDAQPQLPGPEASIGGLIFERFVSPLLARVLSASGDFVAVYGRDATGAVNRVVVAAGDNPDAAMRDGAP